MSGSEFVKADAQRACVGMRRAALQGAALQGAALQGAALQGAAARILALALFFLSAGTAAPVLAQGQTPFPEVRKAGSAPVVPERRPEPRPERGPQEGSEQAQAPGAESAGEPQAAATETGAEPARRLVRTTAETPLYLYENERLAPQVAGPFAQGTLLVVLDAEPRHGFRRVGVLGGMRGWVHGRFLELDADGYARTKGSGVSFRYRPKPRGEAEPPITQMAHGTRLRVLSDVRATDLENSWVEVLGDHRLGAFVPAALLEEAGELAATEAGQDVPVLERIAEAELRTRAEEQIRAQQADWELARQRIAELQKQRQRLTEIDRELGEMAREAQVLREAGDAKQRARIEVLQPRLAQLRERANKVHEELGGLEAASENTKLAAQRLTQQLEETDLLFRGVLLVTQEIEVPVQEASSERPALAPERDFDYVGWLHYRPGTGQPSEYSLSKGGQTIAWLVVPDGRYELREFVGREIGLRGQREQLAGSEQPKFAIERLVVLSGGR